MIKTALTLNISQEDAENTAFLANGTHLGLLSGSMQKTHVQTSHRPLQLIAAFSRGITFDAAEALPSDDKSMPSAVPEADTKMTPEAKRRPLSDEQSGAAAVTSGGDTQHLPLHSKSSQQKMLEAWQAFASLLNRRGSGELVNLLEQYHLRPDWLLCLDEKRLQAWLPDHLNLYLLRGGELRKVKAIEPRASDTQAAFSELLRFYSVNLQINDYLLLLPPRILSFFENGEVAEIIGGLRQLPIKMSEVLNMARMRGLTGEDTWLAWQIMQREADQKMIDDRSLFQRWSAGLSAFAGNGFRKAAAEPEPDESGSESLSGETPMLKTRRHKGRPAAQTEPSEMKQYQFWLIILVPIVVLALVLLVIFNPFGGETQVTDETPEPVVTTTTTAAPTATPSPSPTPEPTPEPEPEYVAVNVNRLNLRAEPNANAQLLSTLNRDDLLQKLSEPEDDWVHVLSEDGLEGYVFYGYVIEVEAEDLEDADE